MIAAAPAYAGIDLTGICQARPDWRRPRLRGDRPLSVVMREARGPPPPPTRG